MTHGDSFEATFRYASIGMAVIGEDGSFIRANPAFLRLTGYDEQELIASDVLAITHADDIAASQDKARGLRRGEVQSYELEKRYIRKDGSIAWVLMSVSAVYRPDGTILHYISQAQDITARREAESAQRAVELRYRQIAEATSDIIAVTRLDGILEYISPSIRQYAWDPEDFTGKRFIDRLHPDDKPIVRRGVRRLLESGGVDRLRWRARHGDTGEWRWFESHACILYDDDGKPEMILDVVRDIHDQVAAAERSATARAAAEEEAKIKSQFLANISHEIRTPLTAVLGFTELLRRRGDLPADAADQIGLIDLAGKGLLALVNDVLDFSKLEAGRFEVRPQATRLTDLAREVAAIFGERAQEKGLDLSYSVDPSLAAPRTLDPDRLRQMLFNLVGNAIKFTERGGVSLRLTEDEPGWVRVEVADTGPGIPPEAQAHLFRRFSQVDGSRSRGHDGAGLGLAITRGVAEAMGGEVGVESAPGLGATFFVRMPAPPVVAIEGAEPEAPPDISGLKVLVVDDNAANRLVAERLLHAVGVEATCVDGGQAALKILGVQIFDAVLLDLRMPGLDGVTTLQRLRRRTGPNQRTAVLAFTADAAAEAETVAQFDGWVSKPIQPLALIQALAACLDIPDAPAAAIA